MENTEYNKAFDAYSTLDVSTIADVRVAAIAIEMAWTAWTRIDACRNSMDRRAVNYLDRVNSYRAALSEIELFVADVMGRVKEMRDGENGPRARVEFNRAFNNERRIARDNATMYGGMFFDGTVYYCA